MLPPDNTALSVVLNGPADGAVVNIGAVQYSGTYIGPSNTGISVNGVRALTNANSFVLPRVILNPGVSTLTFRYATLDAAPVVSTRSITFTSAPQNVLFTARSPGDYSPATMPFTLSTALPAGQTLIFRVQIDYNGDGTFEVDSPNPVALQFAYEEPGLFIPSARVAFDDGVIATPPVIVTDSTRVMMQSMAFTRQTLCGVYGTMKSRLSQNQAAASV